MTHYKKLASQYQENLKVIRIFKGIRKYYWYFFFLLLAIIVGISSTLSILILNNVAKRIKHLALATKSVASGDLDTAVSTEGNDELAELADDFNNMVRDLKETRNKIIYLERMGAWQEVARNLAHEIKNPLTPILLAVQQIEEKAPRNDPAFTGMVRTAAGIVKEEVHTLRRLVDTFGNLARLPDKKEAPIEVIPFLEEFYDLVRLTWKETRLTCDGSLPEGTTVTGDRMLLKRALINVVENAIHAMEGGPGKSALTITVSIERERLSIAVLDKGPGIAQVDKIFNPYFTTKEQGTGLGLPLARKIILDMGAI